MESGRERMGQALAQGERRFRHKIQSASKIAKSFKVRRFNLKKLSSIPTTWWLTSQEKIVY